MSERAFFFNSINGDRKYQADDFVAYFKELVTNGVFKDVDELNLKVQAYSGMKIRINKGAAIINGYRYLNDANLDLTVEASDSINDRIDLVVIRLDESNREITAAIKKGTPGAVPIKPSLITNSIIEMPLASIYISKGSVSIVDSNITDEREFAHSYLDVNHTHKMSDINNDINNVTVEDFKSKLDPNGFIKLPNGTILIIGTVVIQNSGYTDERKITFPTLPVEISKVGFPKFGLYDANTPVSMSASNITTSGFTLKTWALAKASGANTGIGAVRINYIVEAE